LTANNRNVLEVTLVAPSVSASLSPLLSGVLSGWVEPWQMRIPLRDALRNVKLLNARAVRVDPETRRLTLEGPGVSTGCEPAVLAFDDLVIACGTATDHMGVPGAHERSFPLRSLDDALRIRNRVSEVLEAASGEDSSRRRRALTSLVIVGSDHRACACALELARRLRVTSRLFARVEAEDPRVWLVSADEHLCRGWGSKASDNVRFLLQKAGVDVLNGARVERIEDDHAMVQVGGDSQRLEARTVVWTPWSAPQLAVARWSAAPLEKGRLRVDEMLRVAGSECVYALGDCAVGPQVNDEPGALSTPARIVRRARWLAKCLLDRARGRTPRSLAGHPFADSILLDRDHGLAMLGARLVAGRTGAWMTRRSMVAQMPGLRRRLAVLGAWTLSCHLPSAQSDPCRLQPAHQALYLTPPPAEVAPSLPSTST
jgi:NADH dehydrogenase